jgi:hypothetical protein
MALKRGLCVVKIYLVEVVLRFFIFLSMSSGTGSFGIVFAVADTQARTPTTFAMKVLSGGPNFEKEVKMMGQMNSMHVVKLEAGKCVVIA